MEPSVHVSKIMLDGGKNEREGNIMVGGKPVCDDGAKKHGKAAAQVVCRFIFFWSISSHKFTITIINIFRCGSMSNVNNVKMYKCKMQEDLSRLQIC